MLLVLSRSRGDGAPAPPYGAPARRPRPERRSTPISTAHLVVTLFAALANGFSGVGAVLRLPAILPGMARAGVPESWLVFPIGTLKLAGAAGLLLGLLGVPLIGPAAALGLTLYFLCAIGVHVHARDFSAQFGLAIGFVALNTATLVLALAS
ncbi:DoxX family protein [Streptomyces sp. NPDC049881]|uniref:DoxX family protein n=1 Tax=Streptomyces sp. NPDC049881 TaxID=3155778 RepID=UPI00341DFB6A